MATTAEPSTDALLDALRETREALAAAEERFRSAFDHAPIGMALVDLEGRFIDVNASVCALLGYSREELLRLTFQDLTHPDDLETDLDNAAATVRGDVEGYAMEKRYITKHGEEVCALLSVSLVRDLEGEPLHFTSQIVDITERKRMERRLHHLADHDVLTGIWNLRRFEQELARQVARSQRYHEQAALLLLDVDRLKAVNDTLGHRAGDDVLRHVARTMQERLRHSDGVARLGGDEFAALLPRVSRDAAALVARELEAALRLAPRDLLELGVCVDVSIGVAQIDGATRSVEAPLAEADRAMYAAKELARRRR